MEMIEEGDGPGVFTMSRGNGVVELGVHLGEIPGITTTKGPKGTYTGTKTIEFAGFSEKATASSDPNSESGSKSAEGHTTQWQLKRSYE